MTTVYVLTADSGDSLAGDASLMTFSSGRSSPSERICTTNLRLWRTREMGTAVGPERRSHHLSSSASTFVQRSYPRHRRLPLDVPLRGRRRESRGPQIARDPISPVIHRLASGRT